MRPRLVIGHLEDALAVGCYYVRDVHCLREDYVVRLDRHHATRV